MKKLLLGSLLIPVFALAACSSNGGVASSNFRKCTYLSIDGAVMVNEYGYRKTNKIVGTYLVNEDDHDEITENYFVDFPTSFVIFGTYGVAPEPYEQEDPIMPSEISMQIRYGSEYKNYTLTYKENSSAIYESYSDYYYSKATNEFKLVTHEDVKKPISTASYESAYRYEGYLNVSSDAEEYPTGQYKVEQPKYTIKEKSEELYVVLGNGVTVIYALEPEAQS